MKQQNNDNTISVDGTTYVKLDLNKSEKQTTQYIADNGETYTFTLYPSEDNQVSSSSRLYVTDFSQRFEARSADTDVTMSAVFSGSSNPYLSKFTATPRSGIFKSSLLKLVSNIYEIKQSSGDSSSPAHAVYIANCTWTAPTPWGELGGTTTKTLHMLLYPGHSASVYVSVQ
ncbi:hypothetical protein ACWG0P_13085 [Amedibacillus sp. YH-ame6]